MYLGTIDVQGNCKFGKVMEERDMELWARMGYSGAKGYGARCSGGTKYYECRCASEQDKVEAIDEYMASFPAKHKRRWRFAAGTLIALGLICLVMWYVHIIHDLVLCVCVFMCCACVLGLTVDLSA